MPRHLVAPRRPTHHLRLRPAKGSARPRPARTHLYRWGVGWRFALEGLISLVATGHAGSGCHSEDAATPHPQHARNACHSLDPRSVDPLDVSTDMFPAVRLPPTKPSEPYLRLSPRGCPAVRHRPRRESTCATASRPARAMSPAEAPQPAGQEGAKCRPGRNALRGTRRWRRGSPVVCRPWRA